MHLFILGTIIIILLSVNRRYAWTFCFFACILSLLHTSYNVIMYQVQPSILSSLSPNKMSGHANYVHMVTSTYVPAFIVGIISGYYMVTNDSITLLKSRRDLFVRLTITLLLLSLTLFVTVLQSIFDGSQAMSLPIIIAVRAIGALFWISYIVLLFSLKRTSEAKQLQCDKNESAPRSADKPPTGTAGHSDDSGEAPKSGGEQSFNFLKGINRLSSSVFLINYLVIRTLFFTERKPFVTNLSTTVC